VNTKVSQGSVVTRMRRGGIFNRYFIVNLLLRPLVKGFWNSVNIWRNYGYECPVWNAI